MQHRRLGRAGALVSPLALGTDNILNPTPEDESSRMIIRALDGGINLIDTSNSYGAGEAERVIGRVLAESGRRDEVVIATKLHYPTGPGPTTAAIRGCTSCAPASSRCGVYRPIASTSISCIAPTSRCRWRRRSAL